MNLWLDDNREPWNHGCLGWEWVKTAEAAIAALQTGRVLKASLDHDLLPEHYPWNCPDGLPPRGAGTGWDVTGWLVEHPQFYPVGGVALHSANPLGVARMREDLERLWFEQERPS